MDKSKLQAIVEAALPGYVTLFGLKRWKITLQYGRLGDGNAAECSHDLSYSTATIGFDPEKHADEDQVLANLRHELFHLIHGPFDLFYNIAVAGMDEARGAVCDRAWTFSAEQTVVALEAMYAAMLTHLPKLPSPRSGGGRPRKSS